MLSCTSMTISEMNYWPFASVLAGRIENDVRCNAR